jgi:hypothetical protein
MGTFAGGVIVEPSRSFLGSGEVAAVWLASSFLGAEVFFLSSLSLFLPLVLPSLGVFSPAGSFRCLFLLFALSARFMLFGSFFTWVYFLLELFFLCVKVSG